MTLLPPSKDVILAVDEWYLCARVVKHAQDRGFHWIGEAKSNRVVFYQDERLNINDLADRMKPFFRDVDIDGDLYQRLDMEAYIPKLGNVRLLFNCKAGTKDMHHVCASSIKDLSAQDLLKKSFERAKIESFHWGIKNVMGFGDYRFRESEAAITHPHLVLLAYSLLLILKRIEKKRRRLPDQQREHQNHSIGDACRWVRDRCIIAMCRWFKDRISEGLDIP